jgi:hypothetical protein
LKLGVSGRYGVEFHKCIKYRDYLHMYFCLVLAVLSAQTSRRAWCIQGAFEVHLGRNHTPLPTYNSYSQEMHTSMPPHRSTPTCTSPASHLLRAAPPHPHPASRYSAGWGGLSRACAGRWGGIHRPHRPHPPPPRSPSPGPPHTRYAGGGIESGVAGGWVCAHLAHRRSRLPRGAPSNAGSHRFVY